MLDYFRPSEEILRNAHVSQKLYKEMYKESIEDPDKFWAKQAERIDWFKKPTKIKNTDFNSPVSIKWYEDGELNACYNCVDR
ncbi:MAG: acetyl-coenzyme A synthetase, partial [Alphaproteobacteria bacterium]|nr:acetyl-coenzyme A synthetase [Alphaproteobacteria bacterium]